ncbi:MAG TPA: hypothetical protein DCF63_17845 [Planctomycetaceae bacterium]|nr:hypothetical protein [Planctomycetaceae bacterium]
MHLGCNCQIRALGTGDTRTFSQLLDSGRSVVPGSEGTIDYGLLFNGCGLIMTDPLFNARLAGQPFVQLASFQTATPLLLGVVSASQLRCEVCLLN